MTGAITQVTYRPGSGTPQTSGSYNLWLAMEPASVANAAVMVAAEVPVFVRVGGGPRVASSAAALQPGDRVEVWVTANTFYGSPDAPPSAPAYVGQQIVVSR